MSNRTIKCDREFYSKLIGYLYPEERWIAQDDGALCLWTTTDAYKIPDIRLEFTIDDNELQSKEN